MYKKERKSWMKHLDFTILDIICLELAYALSYFMRFGRKNEFLNEEYQRLAVVLILISAWYFSANPIRAFCGERIRRNLSMLLFMQQSLLPE